LPIRYRYFRFPRPLTQDDDAPDLPYGWDRLLIYGGATMVYLQKGDINKAYTITEAKFQNDLLNMKRKLGSFVPDMIFKRKSLERYGRREDVLETPNFDRSVSM
jgi:hypothetical protein